MLDPTNKAVKKGFGAKARDVIGVYYPVILAFLLNQALLYLATLGTEFSIFRPFDFMRSDSALYLDIAKNGYELFPCHERFSGYAANSGMWCGNAGWMPLYPLLVKLFMMAGLQEYLAAYCVSRICFISVLALLFTMCRNSSKSTRLTTMLLAAIFPSSIYYSAAFPISLTLALLLGSFYAFRTGRHQLAYLLAFLTPFAYSTGFLSIAAWGLMGIFLWVRKDKLSSKALLMSVFALCGYLCFFMVQKISTGHWNAFFLIQSKYGHGFHNVLWPIWGMVKSLWLSGINHNWQNIQTLFFIISMIIVAIRLPFEKDTGILFAGLCFVVFAAFPVLVGSSLLAQYRSEALLLPLVLLLGKRKILAVVVSVLFIYLSLNCAIDFFTSQIS